MERLEHLMMTQNNSHKTNVAFASLGDVHQHFGGNSAGASTDIPTGVATVQALFGVRTYFTEVIGANFEIGIGNAPYFVAGGLSFEF